ncbi:MAG: UDP-N-acetylmuramate dehydrogenase [Pyrinomonadaceae bacterium]|nr:UDP-N-acetylmuramate dehydrogenase [Pyrinomonadaceae bacterium]
MHSNLKIEENVSLSGLTTFRIGGEARYFLRAQTEKQVISGLEFAHVNELEVFILGGGSNVLISDSGFSGLVLQVDLKGILFREGDGEAINVTVGAGEDWDEFVGICVEKKLAGIECLSGIPGLVGGTPIQNVGAYGQEVSETLVSVKVFDRHQNKTKTLSKAECGFGYRKSIFNTTEKNRYIVLEVDYSLKKNGAPKIVYSDLKSKFEGRVPSLRETREVVCTIRASKGMLVRQGGLDAQSAGSFFKNPIVRKSKLAELETILLGEGVKGIPNYFVEPDLVKIPAAWLIEQAGFYKGFKKGNAGLSTKHTLAITNRGNATAKEIIDLKADIQNEIMDRFGIDLIPEPNFIGFDNF